MAEFLAVVAASSSVIQCIQSLNDLVNFVQQTKNVEKQMTELLEDVNRLREILSALEKQHYASAIYCPPNPVRENVQRICDNTSDKIHNVASEILAKIKKKRTTGSIRAAPRKDEIRNYRDRLRDLKSDLLLAQASYSDLKLSTALSIVARPLSQQNLIQDANFLKPGLLLDVDNGLTIEPKPASEPTESGPTEAPTCEKLKVYPSSLKVSRCAGRTKKQEWKISGWWLGRVISINFTIRCNNVRSKDVEVFQLVMRLDLSGLQHLVISGQASPFDVDHRGNTLLDVCDFVIFVCRWLTSLETYVAENRIWTEEME